MNKILIVDDALFMRKVIRRNLEEHTDVQIMEACDGDEAVRLYAQWKPDLVLMDITMPNKTGIEELEEIRESDPNARIIMCSAVGQEPMITKALNLGALDFIVKPFKADEFRKVLDYYL